MIEEFDVSAVDSNTKNEALLLIDKKIGDNPIASTVSNEVMSYYEDLSSKASKLTEDMAKVSTTSMSVDKSSQELAKRIETVKEELETTISDLDKKVIRYRNNYSIFSKERGLSKVYDKVKSDYEDFYKKIEILEEKLAGRKAVLDSSIEQLGETTFNEKDQSKIKEIISSLEQKPSEEIIDIESIPRKRDLTTELARERSGLSESTDTTSKIGFQFFANKATDLVSEDDRIATARNRVFEGGLGIGKNNPIAMATINSQIYRVTGDSQIEDILDSGYVRPKEGKLKGGHQNEVFWTKGGDKVFYYDKRPVLQVDSSKLIDNQIGSISIDDLDAIWIMAQILMVQIKTLEEKIQYM